MKGVYTLVISVNKDADVHVGALGKIHFEKGLYVYVGSAQTGVEQRVRRHLRRDKRLFWHIDYLLHNSNAQVIEVLGREAGKDEECKTAKEIGGKGKMVPKFGSSDCHCESHLFKLESTKSLLNSSHLFQVNLEESFA